MTLYRDQEGRHSEVSPVCWNRSAALENVGGDERLLDEVVQIFLEESPRLVDQIEQALLHQNSDSLEFAAHSLKGELSYLGVPEACEIAQKLENGGRTGKIKDLVELFTGLRFRLESLWAALGKNASV